MDDEILLQIFKRDFPNLYQRYYPFLPQDKIMDAIRHINQMKDTYKEVNVLNILPIEINMYDMLVSIADKERVHK